MEDRFITGEQEVRDLDFAINEERRQFAKFFKKFKLYNLILMIGILVIITLSVVLLFPLGEVGMGLALGIIIAVLVGVIVYSKIMKNYTNKRGNKYMAFYYKSVSDFVFKDLKISDYNQDVANQLTFEDFSNAKILKDISTTGSRNLVTYNYHDLSVKVADYASYQVKAKQNSIVFVGKLIVVEGIKPFKERLLIYRRPSAQALKEAVGPTDLDGLNLIVEDNDLLIYAEGETSKNPLNKKAMEALKNFPQEMPFVDMTLSFIGTKLTIAISYSDDLMVIPLPEPFKAEPTDVLRRNIKAIHDFLDLI
ncbi:MAG TPA: hypothetical protein VJZ31_01440 [Bacilli bacterium]|nr:hypothetical protein [Bacilli bacterium]